MPRKKVSPLEQICKEVLTLTKMQPEAILAKVFEIMKSQKIAKTALMKVMVEDGKILICTTMKTVECNKSFNQVAQWQGNPANSTTGSNCYGHFLRALS